jgi:DtxR family transcriptional regulator, Mn-dependent transcriptional regulator
LNREIISPIIEDYLGILYVLERDGEPIVGVKLASLLGVSPPTVTNTLKRMVRDGLVSMGEPTGTRLTEHGLEAARSVMRRHMLTEWMVEKMLPWSRLHEEAHTLEHAISDDVENALLKELDNPALCPHGNPLPGYEDQVAKWQALTKITPGSKVTVRRIHELAEETPHLLNFLEENHILPGVIVQVKNILPFNQTMDIDVAGKRVTLGLAIARYVFVEQISSDERTSPE